MMVKTLNTPRFFTLLEMAVVSTMLPVVPACNPTADTDIAVNKFPSGDCSSLPTIDNGYISNGPSNFGATRLVICNRRHSFRGNSDTIMCQPTGQWSAPSGECELSDYQAWFDSVGRGDMEQVKNFVRSGVNVNQKNKNDDDWTALHLCGANGYPEMSEFLLKNGANVDERNIHGVTPLMYACGNGHKEVAQVFVSNSADVNAKDSKGWTPLINAAANGYEEIVKWLVNESQQININEKTDEGKTALQWAIDQKNRYKGYNLEASCDRIIEFLRTKGAAD